MNHNLVYLYPNAIDSKMKRFEGRKLPIEACVEDPKAEEVYKAVLDLGFQAVLEQDKRHPRDYFRFGRVKVTFFVQQDEQSQKNPFHPEIRDRKTLLRAVSGKISEAREAAPKKAPGKGNKKRK